MAKESILVLNMHIPAMKMHILNINTHIINISRRHKQEMGNIEIAGFSIRVFLTLASDL